MDYRGALFGNTVQPEKRRTVGSVYMSNPNPGARAYDGETQRLFEQNNDRLVEELGDKVDVLRQLTIDIHHETKNQNKLLGDLDDEFDRTGNALTNTVKKLNKLIGAGGGGQLCYLALFVFCLFMFMYLFLRK